MADLHLASAYARVLEGLPKARESARPGREPRFDDYKNGVEVGYYEGDCSGGEGGHSVLVPLEAAPEILDTVEGICRRRLAEMGVEDAAVAVSPEQDK